MQSGPGHSTVCAGGASSWQDLSLYLVARRAGTAEAIRISKLFLYQWHRDGQLPYASMTTNVDYGDAVAKACRPFAAAHYERGDILTAMLEPSGLPKRSFDRRLGFETRWPIAPTTTPSLKSAARLRYSDKEPNR